MTRGRWQRGGASHRSRCVAVAAALLLVAMPGASLAQHRAEQDREITYWLEEPDTHSFRISHDFTVASAGQRYVHNFVRAGSTVRDPMVWDLDRGVELSTYEVTGAQVNALGIYPQPIDDHAVAIQAELVEPLPAGATVRVRVQETYTDSGRYYLDGDELVWDRTLGRPRNEVRLPPGWALTSLNTPAVIDLDEDGRVTMSFVNPRNDSLRVVIRARRR